MPSWRARRPSLQAVDLRTASSLPVRAAGASPTSAQPPRTSSVAESAAQGRNPALTVSTSMPGAPGLAAPTRGRRSQASAQSAPPMAACRGWSHRTSDPLQEFLCCAHQASISAKRFAATAGTGPAASAGNAAIVYAGAAERAWSCAHRREASDQDSCPKVGTDRLAVTHLEVAAGDLPGHRVDARILRASRRAFKRRKAARATSSQRLGARSAGDHGPIARGRGRRPSWSGIRISARTPSIARPSLCRWGQ